MFRQDKIELTTNSLWDVTYTLQAHDTIAYQKITPPSIGIVSLERFLITRRAFAA